MIEKYSYNDLQWVTEELGLKEIILINISTSSFDYFWWTLKNYHSW